MRTLVLALLLLLPLATQNSLWTGLANARPILTVADRNPQTTKNTSTDLDDEQRRINFAPIVFVILLLGFDSAASQCADKLQVHYEDLPPLPIQKLNVVLRI